MGTQSKRAPRSGPWINTTPQGLAATCSASPGKAPRETAAFHAPLLGSCPARLQPDPSPTCSTRNANQQQMGNATTVSSLPLPQGQRLRSCSAFPLSSHSSFPFNPVHKLPFRLSSDAQTSTWGWSITCKSSAWGCSQGFWQRGQLEEPGCLDQEVQQQGSHLPWPQGGVTGPAQLPAAGLRRQPSIQEETTGPRQTSGVVMVSGVVKHRVSPARHPAW